MSDTNPFSITNQWLQYYQETTNSHDPLIPAPDSGQFLGDYASMMPGFATDNVSSLDNPSPTANSTGTGSNSSASPKGGAAKPIRRRSRASKKTPVTLLSTSATNFRALVQQFTGCPSTMAATSSFARQKGPVNLNFERNDHQLTDGSRYLYCNQQESTPTFQHQTQGTFSLGSSISEPARANAQSGLDAFVMENTALRNEFIDDSTVNRSNTNGGYFF